MYYGLYISAAGANAQNQKVEILSNNLANVDTVGFKRELALLEARDAEAIERGMVSRGSQAIEDIGGGVRMQGTATDFSLGALKPTGIPTDLALEDTKMFFAVERDGEEMLTRAGNFQMREDGVLTSADGDPVLATDGNPVQIDPELPWRLMPGGIIDQGGEQTELAIFRATAPQNLLKAGVNCFSAQPSDIEPALPEERRVRTGFLEMSDVNSVEEMVELIATSRSYETNIRMIQNHDSMTGSLVSRMMRPA
jgi:flagellar basal-body rod protein FlgF